jgi:3-hydroxybutyryl-CoA dehydrogenase
MTQKIGVLGAGQMGAGIAQVAAFAGYEVNLYDSNEAALKKGISFIESILQKSLEKEKITADQKKATLSRITPCASLEAMNDRTMCIEAIIENFDIKKELFQKLDTIMPAGGLICSNTSSISITKLAATTKRPEQVIGMHFMNPVPVMLLVEVIRGLQTSDETFATVKEVCDKMGKTLVKGIDGPGFIVNRILCPMINEAIYLLQEGVSPEDIDNAMKLGTNQPMGPLTLADFVGLDTLLYILRILHSELGEDKYRPCPLLIKYVEAGWFGKKTGRGFYRY